MLKRLCQIDIDSGRLVCPWGHGVQDDEGARLSCGCPLETGAHGRVYAVRSGPEIGYPATLADAANCETGGETATDMAVKRGETVMAADVDNADAIRNDTPRNQ